MLFLKKGIKTVILEEVKKEKGQKKSFSALCAKECFYTFKKTHKKAPFYEKNISDIVKKYNRYYEECPSMKKKKAEIYSCLSLCIEKAIC